MLDSELDDHPVHNLGGVRAQLCPPLIVLVSQILESD